MASPPADAPVSMTPIAPPFILPEYGNAEPASAYGAKGFLEVSINQVLADRWVVLDKLGWGGYSTVWLVEDRKLKRHMALKINKAECLRSQYELQNLVYLHVGPSAWPSYPGLNQQPLETNDYVITPRSEVWVHTAYGLHICYTMDVSHGDLRRIMTDMSLFPIQIARAVAAKLILAVNFMHDRGVVHGDLRCDNALIRRSSAAVESFAAEHRQSSWPAPDPEQDPEGLGLQQIPSHLLDAIFLGVRAGWCSLQDAQSVVISDFGEAFRPSMEQRLGRDCYIPSPRRAPEALFEPDAPVSFPSDVWSLAIMIWEVLGVGADPFYEAHSADRLVANQLDVLGLERLPAKWKEIWERDADDEPATYTGKALPRPPHDHELLPDLEEQFETYVQKRRREEKKPDEYSSDEASAILAMIRGMLDFNPDSRWTTEQILKTDWMVNWGLPALYGDTKQDASEPAAPRFGGFTTDSSPAEGQAQP